MRPTGSSDEPTRASKVVLVLPACVDVPTTSLGLIAENAVPANANASAPVAATSPARSHLLISPPCGFEGIR